MLPADAIGMLNVTNEIDTGREHSIVRDIKIVDAECDYRPCGEERMEFIGRTIEFQNGTIGKPKPYQVISLPSDRHT
jgi:hypothetical protein